MLVGVFIASIRGACLDVLGNLLKGAQLEFGGVRGASASATPNKLYPATSLHTDIIMMMQLVQ